MNALNALLNYLIVFQPVELPLHGVEGIACAYAFSEGCAAFTMLLLLLVLPLGLDFRHKSIRSSFRILPKVLQIGIPGGISTLSLFCIPGSDNLHYCTCRCAGCFLPKFYVPHLFFTCMS